ncbi:MAG: hypothetical protein Q8M08_17465 [Bacteroidales bacterium]|nr:hypothetical protein [Bacteroidales bacterium]
MTYADVLAVIKYALSQRPSGQKVLVSSHEAAEIKILDYIQQTIGLIPSLTEAQVTTVADTQIQLIWPVPFPNSLYTFTINGFSAQGGPAEVILINKNPGYLTIKTWVAASVYAIALPHNANP